MLVNRNISVSEGDVGPTDACFTVMGEFGGRSVSIMLQSSAEGTGKKTDKTCALVDNLSLVCDEVFYKL